MLVGVIAEESLMPSTIVDSFIMREAANADDLAASGLFYAALVDDPASVTEILDAYLGSVIAEPTNADDAPDAQGPPIGADLAESASASESCDAVGLFTADIAETASASDTDDATIVGAPANTWNPSDLAQITLSGGNLSAQSTGTSAGVRHFTGHNSGKYYWEITTVNWGATSTETGIATSSSVLAGGGLAGQAVVTRSLGGFNGSIYINGTYTNSQLGPNFNNVIGIAVDLTAGLIWFRLAPTGNWNGSSTANPATGAGGLSLGALTGTILFPFFGAALSAEDVTANFGASAFTGTVPSGFNSGW